MQHTIKDFSKSVAYRMRRVTGHRMVKNKRWGVDWLDDCTRIAREKWNPRFTSLDIVFDVGGNIGQTIRKVRQKVTPSQLHSFEPVSETYAQLR